MSTLVDFLRARLDEDEEAANTMLEVFPTPWDLLDRGHSARIVADGPAFLNVTGIDQSQAPEGTERWPGDFIAHIARHDPARVLAEVAAKRLVVELHDGDHECREIHTGTYPADWSADASWGTPGGTWRHASTEGFEGTECPTLRHLVQPYADHPDYREEWRP